MVDEAVGSGVEGYGGGSIRDLEEQNRNLKDRLILVAQNFIDFRNSVEDEILDMKQDIQVLKNSVEKIRDFIETLSGEFSKVAKKDDLDILVKQAKMFQPMEFVRKKELAELIKKKTSHNANKAEKKGSS